MDDAALVCGSQTAADLHGGVERDRQRQRRCADAGPEGFPLEKLGREVRHTVVAADVMDGQDVGVRQRGDGTCLAIEPLAEVRIRRGVRRHGLDRNLPPQPRIARPIHLTHPAGADDRHNLIDADTGTWDKRHVGVTDYSTYISPLLVPRRADSPREIVSIALVLAKLE